MLHGLEDLRLTLEFSWKYLQSRWKSLLQLLQDVAIHLQPNAKEAGGNMDPYIQVGNMAVPQLALLAQGKQAKQKVVEFEATTATSEPTWHAHLA